MSPIANYDQRNVLDYRFGQLSAGVTALDTTMSSTAFASLPGGTEVSTTRYIPITIADDSLGLYETVWITAHTASSQAVTVVRGREGTTARAWGAGTTWRVAPTIRDVQSVVAARGNLPVDPHIGQRVYIVAEDRVVERTAKGWDIISNPPFGHVGCTDGFQSIASGNGAYVLFSTAQELAGGMTFENANDALVVPVAGLYEIKVKGYLTGGSLYTGIADATINSATVPPGAALAGAAARTWKEDATDYALHGSVRRRLAAADKIRLWQATPQSVWGTTGYDGAFLEVLWVGP